MHCLRFGVQFALDSRLVGRNGEREKATFVCLLLWFFEWRANGVLSCSLVRARSVHLRFSTATQPSKQSSADQSANATKLRHFALHSCERNSSTWNETRIRTTAIAFFASPATCTCEVSSGRKVAKSEANCDSPFNATQIGLLCFFVVYCLQFACKLNDPKAVQTSARYLQDLQLQLLTFARNCKHFCAALQAQISPFKCKARRNSNSREAKKRATFATQQKDKNSSRVWLNRRRIAAIRGLQIERSSLDAQTGTLL